MEITGTAVAEPNRSLLGRGDGSVLYRLLIDRSGVVAERAASLARLAACGQSSPRFDQWGIPECCWMTLCISGVQRQSAMDRTTTSSGRFGFDWPTEDRGLTPNKSLWNKGHRFRHYLIEPANLASDHVPSLILLAGALLTSFAVAAVTGASSVSVSMAPAVGANSTGVLRGAFLVGIVGFVGAVAQGAAVTRGVGTSIVSGSVSFEMGTIALLVIGLYVGLGIYFQHSIPVAFSTFGAIAGVGLAAGYSPNLGYWSLTLASWVASGVVAVFLAYGTVQLIRRYVPESARMDHTIDRAVMFAGIVFSFIGGGSQVGLAVGPLVGTVQELGFGILPLIGFGGLGIMVGAWTKSPVMLQAVGRQYASLGQRTSLAVLLTAIPMVQIIANTLGVPISYNHIIINSIAGCGFAGAGSTVDTRKYAGTLASWILTLLGSTGTAYLMYLVSQYVR